MAVITVGTARDKMAIWKVCIKGAAAQALLVLIA